MAHRSYPSPDGRWALVVGMDRGRWMPCRLVPMSGDSAGRPVGPPGAACTFAAWTPDGQWMFLNANIGGAFHVWRQRFPEGEPEQVTSGVSEEEGLAIDPDGRSLVTSVGQSQSAVWLRQASGERQVSLEGYSYDVKFTPDEKHLCYRVLKGVVAVADPGELRIADLESGRNAPLLPGHSPSGYIGRAYRRFTGREGNRRSRAGQGRPLAGLARPDQWTLAAAADTRRERRPGAFHRRPHCRSPHRGGPECLRLPHRPGRNGPGESQRPGDRGPRRGVTRRHLGAGSNPWTPRHGHPHARWHGAIRSLLVRRDAERRNVSPVGSAKDDHLRSRELWFCRVGAPGQDSTSFPLRAARYFPTYPTEGFAQGMISAPFQVRRCLRATTGARIDAWHVGVLAPVRTAKHLPHSYSITALLCMCSSEIRH